MFANKNTRIFLFLSSAVYMFFSMFHFDYTIGIIGIIFSFGLYILIDKIKSKKVKISIVLICIFLCVGVYNIILNGIFLIFNQISYTYGVSNGIPTKQLIVSIGSREKNFAILLVFVLWISLLMNLFKQVKNLNSFKIIYIVFGVLFILSMLGMKPSVVSLSFFLITILLIYFSGWQSILLSTIISICIIVLWGSGIFNTTGVLYTWHKHLISAFDEIRYGENEGTLPQGDFTSINRMNRSGETALTIYMKNPSSMYLRGFVGSNYTNNKWEDLDNKLYYDSYDLFFWLEKYNFRPINQLEIVSKELDYKTDRSFVKVVNNNASRNYIYLPYEVSIENLNIEESKKISITNTKAAGFFGSKEYSFQSVKDIVNRYPLLVKKYGSIKSITNYKVAEENYRAYVFENFLTVPPNIKTIFKNEIGVDKDLDNQTNKYFIVNEMIHEYFKKNIIYDEKVTEDIKGHDFLENFLLFKRRGYDIHYATTATLIYRYLGIPARYVEGYLITPNDILYKKDYEPIQIKNYNAHAWVEIYQEGIGWIPIEVTPKYKDVMAKNFDGFNNVSNNYIEEENRSPQTENIPLEEKIKEEKVQLHHNQFEISLGIVIICVIIVSLFSMVIYIIKRGKKLYQYLFFNSNDVNAIHIINHIIKLIVYELGEEEKRVIYRDVSVLLPLYGEEYTNDFKKIIKTYNKAIFSNHKIKDEELDEVFSFLDRTLEMI